MSDASRDQKLPSLPQAKRLLELLTAPPQEVFRTPTGRVFVVLDGEALPVDGRTFAERLAAKFVAFFDEIPSEGTIKNAVRAMSGRALPRRHSPVRLGGGSGRLLLDLGIEGTRRAIEITAGACVVLERADAAFWRPHGTSVLPDPVFPTSDAEARDSLADFFSDLGVSNRSRVAVVAFLLSAMRPAGPYSALIIRGEQGSGKSWLARVVRQLLDPRRPPLQRLPDNTRDLAIVAEHAHVLAFDNVSAIRGDVSDALCTLATGDGFVTRAMYTDRELAVFDASRPVLISSVTDAAVTRADLLDRAIVDRLKARERREDDAELEQRFVDWHPRALGALCFLAHRGLQQFETARVPTPIRMREPARFAAAAESAAGFPFGAVAHVYLKSREDAAEVAALDPVVSALLEVLRPGEQWRGTATQLLLALKTTRDRCASDLPQTARGLRSALDRHVPALRDFGIEVSLPTEETRIGHDRAREIVIDRKQVAPRPVDDSLSLFFFGKCADDRPHRPQTPEARQIQPPDVRAVSAVECAQIPSDARPEDAASPADTPAVSDRPPQPALRNGLTSHAFRVPSRQADGSYDGITEGTSSPQHKEEP